SESVMSRGTLSTTALLRPTMERPDSVVAGQLPASGDTEGSSWRRAVGGRSSSAWDEVGSHHSTTRARSRRDEAEVVRLAHGNWGRAASRRGDPRGWRGARAGRSKAFRQPCEDARGDPAGAHDPPDAAILQTAWGQPHLRISPGPRRKGSLDLRRSAADARPL